MLDGIIPALYVFVVLGFGLWAGRRQKTTEQFFLAGRGMSWPLIGLSLFASNISSTTLIGLAGGAYASGIVVYNYEWMATVILIFFAAFVLPALLRSRVYTIPEFLERRYDRRIRTWFAIQTIVLNVFVDLAGTLYGGSVLLQMAFPSAPLVVIAGLLAVTAGLYATIGGLRSVIFTEALQVVILVMSSALIAGLALEKAGGWAVISARIDPALLSLIRPGDDPNVPWLGLLTGVPLLGFYFWCTNQFMVQRVLAAKDLRHGRLGCIFAGFLKLSTLPLMVFPGLCAILIYPNLQRPDLVYPSLLFGILRPGIIGLALAGFLSAVLASIASTINGVATVATLDIAAQFWPRLGGRAAVRTGRFVTALVVLVAVLWTPRIGDFSSLWQYLQAALAYVVPPVVALFAIGLIWRGATARGAMAALIIGAVSGVVLLIGRTTGLVELHFLLAAPLIFTISAAALVAVSYSDAPQTRSGGHFAPNFGGANFNAIALSSSTISHLSLRVFAFGLLALTFAIVWTFR